MDVYICHNSYTHAKKDAPEKLFITRSGEKVRLVFLDTKDRSSFQRTLTDRSFNRFTEQDHKVWVTKSDTTPKFYD